MDKIKIFGIDFDGTLCEDKWPEIGEPNHKMINYCKGLIQQGHKLILWTCRTGKKLEDAVKWCNDNGLFFHAVNSNLPDKILEYDNDCRKVFADYYIDDKNLKIEDVIK